MIGQSGWFNADDLKPFNFLPFHVSNHYLVNGSEELIGRPNIN
jgi:hypothetical protein